VYWQTPETFDHGHALFEAVCEHELEGVVAKRRGRYPPGGERGRVKNRNYWRYEMERESAISRRRERVFV
jgi:ATP-dependent DNA ligase